MEEGCKACSNAFVILFNLEYSIHISLRHSFDVKNYFKLQPLKLTVNCDLLFFYKEVISME